MTEQSHDVIINTLYAKGRERNRHIVGWYDKVFQQVSSRERSGDTLAMLRHLFYIVLVNIESPDVPIHLVEILSQSAVDSEREILKPRLLCAAILRDLAPIPSLPTAPLPPDPSNLPLILPFLLQQGIDQRQIAQAASQMTRSLTHTPPTQDLDALVPILACLNNLHHACRDVRLIGSDEINSLNKQLGAWLRFAPKTQVTGGFPLTKIQKKQAKNFVKELDGATCQDFFTCLNLASNYGAEQMLNVISWSLMRNWIDCTYDQWEAVEVLFLASRGSTPSISGRESPLIQSTNTSPPDTTPSSSPVPVLRSSSSFMNESMDGSLTRLSTSGKPGSNTFPDRIVEYCQRIIDQSQRKPLKKEDDEVLQACLVEAVVLIDRICLRDGGLSSKLFPSLKRLLLQSSDRERVLLHLVEFFLHHGDVIAFDTDKALDSFFGSTIANSYHNQGLVTDTILFGLRNADTLKDGSVFTRYFPNWLKILAWNPVTYVQDFQQLLPYMLTSSTAVELLHFLLDLPCLAAALQAQQYSKDGLTSFSESVQACQEHSYQFVFNFLLRNEAGQCDTIDKLDSLLLLLSDMSSHPRVLSTCDVTPILLTRYFQSLLSADNKLLASKVVPVVLERSRQLYKVTRFRKEVRTELQTALMNIFQKYPDILMDHASELLEFVGQHSSLSFGNDEFFSYVVFLVGEYTRQRLDARCNSETYDQFYEVFESLAYEVSASIHDRSIQHIPQGGVYSAKLVMMLLTAMSKLASRSQTLIPRVILCIRKVDQQAADSSLPASDKRILCNRASQLISALRLPNIASIVFNPPLDLHLPSVILSQVNTAQYLSLINSELSSNYPLRP